MKKILIILYILGCCPALIAQVQVSTKHLELKKSARFNEILAAKEAENRALVVFAADKKTLTAQRYNAAFFYKDSIITSRPNREYDYMAGYSYSNSTQAQVYWANADFTKIQAVNFNFEAATVTTATLQLPLREETVLTTFSHNNTFYLVALPGEGDKLKLYRFNDGSYKATTLDFSKFKFRDVENDSISFSELVRGYGLQKIEPDGFTALPTAAGPVKLYAEGNKMVLTLDHNPVYTQLFTIDSAYTVRERLMPQIRLKKAFGSTSNSFYFKDKLYQLKLNDEELALYATDITTGKIEQSHRATANDSIAFKNSSLLSQTGNRRAVEFKNTEKFLQKAALGVAALSVYQTPDDLLVAVGAVRNVVSAQNAVLSVALTGVVIAGGGGGDVINLFDADNLQSVYFEGLFDEDFNHKPFLQGRLAIDKVGQFIEANRRSVSLETLIPVNGYYLLGFYDAKRQHYVLLKFEDEYAY